jgi:hypothetical protein
MRDRVRKLILQEERKPAVGFEPGCQFSSASAPVAPVGQGDQKRQAIPGPMKKSGASRFKPTPPEMSSKTSSVSR